MKDNTHRIDFIRMDIRMMVHNFPSKQIDSDIELPAPIWDHLDRHYVGHFIQVLARGSKAGFLRFVIFRGNKIAYSQLRCPDRQGLRHPPLCQKLRYRTLANRNWPASDTGRKRLALYA